MLATFKIDAQIPQNLKIELKPSNIIFNFDSLEGELIAYRPDVEEVQKTASLAKAIFQDHKIVSGR